MGIAELFNGWKKVEKEDMDPKILSALESKASRTIKNRKATRKRHIKSGTTVYRIVCYPEFSIGRQGSLAPQDKFYVKAVKN